MIINYFSRNSAKVLKTIKTAPNRDELLATWMDLTNNPKLQNLLTGKLSNLTKLIFTERMLYSDKFLSPAWMPKFKLSDSSEPSLSSLTLFIKFPILTWAMEIEGKINELTLKNKLIVQGLSDQYFGDLLCIEIPIDNYSEELKSIIEEALKLSVECGVEKSKDGRKEYSLEERNKTLNFPVSIEHFEEMKREFQKNGNDAYLSRLDLSRATMERFSRKEPGAEEKASPESGLK